MFDRLRILFAEQTTADEVIIFLLVCVALALALAFFLYALVLAAFWHGRLREVTGLRALLFPSTEQLRAYLGEYALAGATAALLTLTIAARHEAVETVLAYSLEVGEDVPAASLPTVGLSVAVESLLRPSLEAGRAEHANLLVETLLGSIGADQWGGFPTRAHLLFLAVFVLLAYVLWFAWTRSRAVERDGGPGETGYGQVAGRLLVPALCFALLLVSAAGASDPRRVARSAVAVAALRGLDCPSPDGQPVERLLARQSLADSLPGVLSDLARLEAGISRLAAREADLRDTTRALAAADVRVRRETLALLDELRGQLEGDRALSREETLRLAARVDSVRGDLLRAERRADGLAAETRAAREQAAAADSIARVGARSLGALGTRVQTLAREARMLEAEMERLAGRLPDRGLLLVVSPQVPYQIHAGGAAGAVRASGSGVGLHALPPGEYAVTSAIGNAARTLAVGEAETVQLQRPVIGLRP